MQIVKKPANPLILNDRVIVFDHIEIMGQGVLPSGEMHLVIRDLKSILEKEVPIPVDLLASGQTGPLQKLFIKYGLYTLAAKKPNKVQEELLRVMQEVRLKPLVISEGFQDVTLNGIAYKVLTKNGVCYPVDNSVSASEFHLSGRAAEKIVTQKNMEDFFREFSVFLEELDRFLVILIAAIAAYFFCAFDVSRLTFLLVGKSSHGKSTIQRAVSFLVEGRNSIRDFNATIIGMLEFCAAQGSKPIFLEDAHKAGESIMDLIMESGNGSGRFRSNYGKNQEDEKYKKMTGVAIVSSEMSLDGIAKRNRLILDRGVNGRSIEIPETDHGMFENLCGFETGAKLSERLDALAPDYASVIGDAAISEIASHFTKHKEQWIKRKNTIRKKIILAAELEDNLDGVDARVLNGLVFCAFIGRQISNAGLLPVSRNRIYEAFGRVFKERINSCASDMDLLKSQRSMRTIKSVQAMLIKNKSKFSSKKQEPNDNSKKVVGIMKNSKKNGEVLYLIKPNRFKSLLGEAFHSKTTEDLRANGYLVTSRRRGYHYQQRVGEELKDFIAIRASILEAQSR